MRMTGIPGDEYALVYGVLSSYALTNYSKVNA